MSIANKIYVGDDSRIKPEFKDIAINKFDSEIENVDFGDSDAAAGQINAWVEEKTNNKIRNLVDPAILNDNTKMILINAIHFKGIWKNSFSKADTFTLPFWVNETSATKAEFMYQNSYFSYGQFDEFSFTALKMDYSSSNVSMLVLLPKERTGLPLLEQKLHTIDLKSITQQMEEQEVDVRFPKFKIEFEITMNDILINLGINDIFNENANLTEILTNHEQLIMNKVIQKAFIDVNEEGTEAAASTAFGKI